MKSLVSENLEEVLKKNTIKGEDVSKVKGYIEALRLYESLVNSKLTTKRGNNLLSKDKTFITSVKFNS